MTQKIQTRKQRWHIISSIMQRFSKHVKNKTNYNLFE